MAVDDKTPRGPCVGLRGIGLGALGRSGAPRPVPPRNAAPWWSTLDKFGKAENEDLGWPRFLWPGARRAHRRFCPRPLHRPAVRHFRSFEPPWYQSSMPWALNADNATETCVGTLRDLLNQIFPNSLEQLDIHAPDDPRTKDPSSDSMEALLRCVPCHHHRAHPSGKRQ